MKSELQNGVDRLRQKLHDVETHSQDKQNKFNLDKQQWEYQRLEWIGKVNEVIRMMKFFFCFFENEFFLLA